MDSLKAFLSSLDLDSKIDLFLNEEIRDLETLAELNGEDLEGLGLKLGARKKILKGLRELGTKRLDIPEATRFAIYHFPYTIAWPLKALYTKTDVEACTKSLVDVLTNVLKYQAMIVQSEYLYSDLVDEELNAIIRRDLSRPLVSSWLKFIEAALHNLDKSGHRFFVPELKAAYEKAETSRNKNDLVKVPGKGYHDEHGEFIAVESKLGLFRALVSYRNKFAHGFNQPEPEFRKELGFYLGVMDSLLKELSWMANYPLLKRENGDIWQMMGSEPAVTEKYSISSTDEHGLVLLNLGSLATLPLFPLFIVPGEYIADPAAGEDLLVFDQCTGKRLVYISPRGHHRETEGPMREWQRLISAKESVLPKLGPGELTPVEITRRAERATADEEALLYSSRKVLKNTYLPREDLERYLAFYLKSSFQLALVSATAGAGKTTLLHHMIGQWRANGASVLYMRAISFKVVDFMHVLRDQLNLNDHISFRELATHGASNKVPLVIVVEGLNEHGERGVLLQSILSLVTNNPNTSNAKIVLSWRSDDRDWADAAKAKRHLFFPFPETSAHRKGDIPALHVGPLKDYEVEAFWALYKKRDPKRYSPKFSWMQIFGHSRLRRDLKNPLLLRVFLETFHQKKLPADNTPMYFYREWFAGLGKKTGDGNDFLLNLARTMLQQNSTRIELSALYEDERMGQMMRRLDVASPFNRLSRREGVVMVFPGEPETVGFVMDRFLEQACGQVLIRDRKAVTPADLVEALDALYMHPHRNPIIETALTVRISAEGRRYLWDFIDHLNALPVDSRLKAVGANIAGEVLGEIVRAAEDIDPIVDELMAEPTHGDLAAAYYADDFLRYFYGEPDRRFAFNEAVIARLGDLSGGSRVLAWFYGGAAESAWATKQYETSKSIYERALNIWIELEGEVSEKVAECYQDIGYNLFKLDDFQHAKINFEKYLEIAAKIFKGDHPKIALGYLDLGRTYQKLEALDEAERCFDRALSIYSKIPEAHGGIIDSYLSIAHLSVNQGEDIKAGKVLEQCLSLATVMLGEAKASEIVTRQILPLLSDLNKVELYEAFFRKIEDRPDSAHERVIFGQLLVKNSRTQDAIKQFRLAVDVDNDWAKMELGKLLVFSDNPNDQDEGLGLIEEHMSIHQELYEWLDFEEAGLLDGLDDLDRMARIEALRARIQDLEPPDYGSRTS